MNIKDEMYTVINSYDIHISHTHFSALFLNWAESLCVHNINTFRDMENETQFSVGFGN